MSGSAESESRHFTGIQGAERVFFYALRTPVLRRCGGRMSAMRTDATRPVRQVGGLLTWRLTGCVEHGLGHVLPLAVEQALERAEICLVDHFAALLNPVAEVDVR